MFENLASGLIKEQVVSCRHSRENFHRDNLKILLKQTQKGDCIKFCEILEKFICTCAERKFSQQKKSFFQLPWTPQSNTWTQRYEEKN